MKKKKRLIDIVDKAIKRYAKHGNIVKFISDVRFAVINTPAMYAVEVAHGKWEFDCACEPICSVCGKYAMIVSDYCPNCGAKMET